MLLNKLQEDLKQAQLQRDEMKVSVLRMLVSETKYASISKGDQLSDEDVLAVISREVKKRREAAAGFRQGGREEDAQKEEKEAQILLSYLPEQISDEELTLVVEEAINNTGAASISDMGKVISQVLGKVAGRAEGSRVSALVKEKLSK